MTATELLLGSARAAQILLSIVTLGLASGTVSQYNAATGREPLTPGRDSNNFAVFQSLVSLVSVGFLVASQFVFIKRFEGYRNYLNLALLVELVNWIFLFASFIAIASFQAGTFCSGEVFRRRLGLICDIDSALIAFQVLLWLAWSLSLGLLVKLKHDERQDFKTSQEIELRIKNAVAAGLPDERGHVGLEGAPPVPLDK